jgi:hypothetical protein
VVPLIRMPRSTNHFITRVEYQEIGAGHDLYDPGAALRIGLKHFQRLPHRLENKSGL